MRSLLLLPLLTAASVARAATTYTPFVDPRTVDPPCRVFAEVPATATTMGPAYDAAISTASCLVSARTRGLHLDASSDSVLALDRAVAPALEILDRVIQAADTEHQVIALYAKANILAGNSARLLATVPKLSPQMSSQEVHDRYRQVLVTDALTLPWRQRALATRRQIATVVYRDPQVVVRNPVVAYMVRDTRISEAAGVSASR